MYLKKSYFKGCDKRTRNAREKPVFQLLFMCVLLGCRRYYDLVMLISISQWFSSNNLQILLR